MRQTTLDESGRHNKTDLGSSVDSGNEVFASNGENDPDASREKGLPTIFKYNGQGKEVYVCGKNSILFFGPIIDKIYSTINCVAKSDDGET